MTAREGVAAPGWRARKGEGVRGRGLRKGKDGVREQKVFVRERVCREECRVRMIR